ncbi:MAG: transposase [Dehalococcoidia bacterium]|nr:transposase [Dehalococcoidia bacterium]
MAVDIHEPFRQAIQICLPHTKVVADKFHPIRRINGALDKVRSTLHEEHRKKTRNLFKSRYAFLKRVESLVG